MISRKLNGEDFNGKFLKVGPAHFDFSYRSGWRTCDGSVDNKKKQKTMSISIKKNISIAVSGRQLEIKACQCQNERKTTYVKKEGSGKFSK